MTIELPRWERPRNYFGFAPVGDYYILSIHRDSGPIDLANFDVAKERLEDIASQLSPPKTVVPGHSLRYAYELPPYVHDYDSLDTAEPLPWVYVHHSRHWAVGWLDELLIRQDAPKPIVDEARKILNELCEYPCLDDERAAAYEEEEKGDD